MVKLLGLKAANSLKFDSLGKMVGIVFFLLIVSGLLVTIQSLISNYWCREGFEEKPKEATEEKPKEATEEKPKEVIKTNKEDILKRTRDLQSLRELIMQDIESLDDAADASCDITKQVEDSYVSNNSAPTNEDEYQMPPDIQKERQAKRNKRSSARFNEEKKRFSALKNLAPVYECYEDAGIGEAEEELRAEITEIKRILETAEAKALAAKGSSLQSLLEFNAVYLKKAASTVTEGFAVIIPKAPLTGAALLAAADEIITNGNAVHMDVVNITAAVKTQQDVAKGVFQKTKNIQNGQVTEADAAKAAKKSTSVPS
jgi:hypothetical protein